MGINDTYKGGRIMEMEQLKKTMLEKKVWAVVGANSKRGKFGNIIYKKLKSRGYDVYPVNPNYDEIEGERCYHNIDEIPTKVDCVDFVVPPSISKKVIEQVKQAGIEYIWMQPGSYDNETIDIAKENELNVVYNNCVLQELG